MRVFIGTRPLSRDLLLLWRDDDLRRLRNLLLADRVVLLLGRSGCGKTSLIEGLGGLRDMLQHDFPKVQHVDSGLHLHGAENVCTLYDKVTETIAENRESKPPPSTQLVILDQLERGFQWTHVQRQRPAEELFTQVGNLIRDHQDTTFLLVLQEEFLAELQALRQLIPGQLTIQYRLAGIDPVLVAGIDSVPLASIGPVRADKLVEALDGGDSLSVAFKLEFAELLRRERPVDQNSIDPFAVQALGWLLETAWDPRRLRGYGGELGRAEARERAAAALRQELNQLDLASCYLDRCLRDAPLRYSRSRRTTVLAELADACLNAEFGRIPVRIPAAAAQTSRRSAAARCLRCGLGRLRQKTRSSAFLEYTPPSLWATLKEWGIITPLSSDTYQLAHDRLVPALLLARRTQYETQRQKRPWIATAMILLAMLLALWLKPTRPPPPPPPPREYPPPRVDTDEFWADALSICREQVYNLQAQLDICLDRPLGKRRCPPAAPRPKFDPCPENLARSESGREAEKQARYECQLKLNVCQAAITKLCSSTEGRYAFQIVLESFLQKSILQCPRESVP